jgi:uncharacterized protein with NRDE domain
MPMCLILFSHQQRADLPLLVLANRDEYFDRATAPLAPWAESPGLVAGRDLLAGGTWLGANLDGRWAAVTNVREGERTTPGAPSRGWLVRDYLLGSDLPELFSRRLAARAREYAGFNLLLGADREIWYVSNRKTAPLKLPPGLYGLSNGRLDAPWPKVERGKMALAQLIEDPDPTVEEGLCLLADRERFPDHHLPENGVPLKWERALSATFIDAPERGYGTRCSTVLLRSAKGETLVVERSFAGSPGRWSQSCYRLSGAGAMLP